MMECVRLIIGEEREGERGERDKRSVDRLIQNNLDGREGTAMLGRDKEGDAVVDCRHHPHQEK